MKKILALMMALVLAFSLAGCGLVDVVGDYFESEQFEQEVDKAVDDINSLLD